jgi:hypothetical protein
MKTLIAVTSALFITVACQKKVEVPTIVPAPTAEASVQQNSAEDTTTLGNKEKNKEVECQD